MCSSRRLFGLILSGLSAALVTAVAAIAQTRDSVYTALEACQERDAPTGAPLLLECAPQGEWRVFLGASDHASRLAVGSRGMDAQFAQSPLTRGVHQNVQRTIEWRGFRDANGFAPYATITRWRAFTPQFNQETGDFTSALVRDQDVLVVAALRADGPVSACHVAYIDAAEVGDANTIARRIADTRASEFVCGEAVLRVDAANAARFH